MYDLNQPDQLHFNVDPAVEFRARFIALTPNVFVTQILVALNVVVFLAMIAKGVSPMQPTIDSLLRWGADFGPRTVSGGEWWRMFTSMFLHIGAIHIAFNMFVLWQVGPFVERMLGNMGFLTVYLISGLVGALVSLAWKPYVVSAGASGAIFGLYGALIGFLLMRRDSVPPEVLSPLIKNALIFVGYNAVFGFMRSGTDIADHAGGLAAGFVCGLVMSVPLTVEGSDRRAIRNLVVALGAVVVLAAGTAKLPRPVDFQAELGRFVDVESKTLAAYRAALIRGQTEKLRNEDLADLVDRNVIPNWAAEHNRLAQLHNLPDKAKVVVSRVLSYMEARQQAWSMLVAGLRQHNNNTIRQAYAMQHAADVMARQVGSGRN